MVRADSPSWLLATRLGEAVAQIQTLIRRDLAMAGISLVQARVLATLERHGSLRLTDLAVLEQVRQPTMSSQVARLGRFGLVSRAGSPDDGRAVIVRLTRAGQASLKSIRRRRALLLTAHLDQLAPGEVAALDSALPALGELIARLESRNALATSR